MNPTALFAIFRLGARKTTAERAVILGQVMVYCVLVSAYGVFFRNVSPETLQPFGLSVPQLIWYLTITQIVISATPLHWRDLDREISEGSLDVAFTRPIPFWQLNLAEWFGQYIVRVVIIAPFGFAIAWYLSGVLLINGLAPLFAILLCLALAGLLFLCLHCMVGCSTLWADPVEPVYRIWQKALFLLGARSSPLLLYPLWSQALVWYTPFPAMLAVPGNIIIGASHPRFAWQLAAQGLWLAVGIAAVAGVAHLVRVKTMRDG